MCFLTQSAVSGNPGDTVEVELTVASAVSYNSVALSKLNYDKAALEFVGFTTYSDMENKCYFPGGFDSANTAIALALKTLEAGDMDSDGTVTRKDAMILARKNAGWTTNTGE